MQYKRSESPTLFQGKLLGRITGCTNPESAELLPDGEHFVFGNCKLIVGVESFRAGHGIVYVKDEAFVSQGKVNPNGDVHLLNRKLIAKLTATLGIDILKRATTTLPHGTAFIVSGGNPQIENQTLLDPSKVVPAVIAFDGITGEIRGTIDLHEESPIGQKYNRIDQPNGCATDAAGNLYFGDIPNGNPDPDPSAPPPVPSAIYKIPHQAIDGLLSNSPKDAEHVQRIVIPNFVNGLTASPIDEAIYAVSCHALDEANGGIFRLESQDFDSGQLPSPIIRDIGLFLDGVGISKRGTLFASTPVTGEIHAFTPKGQHMIIRLGEETIVRMPADFNVCYPNATRGEPCILVTDISVGSPSEDGSVAVVELRGL